MAFYIEVNMLCFMMLAILLAKVKVSVVTKREEKEFCNICFHSMLIILLDVLWKILDGASFDGAHTLNVLVNAGYFAETGIITYYWVMYTQSVSMSGSPVPLHRRVCFALPMLVIVILSICTIWTGWFFVVDEDNCYQRGPLMFVQLIFEFSYMGYIFIYVLRRIFEKRNFVHKDKLNTIMVLGVIPFFGQICQLLLPGNTFFCVCIKFALTICFVSNQKRLISTDALTHMNNRSRLYAYLDKKIHSRVSGKDLFLFLMDVDDFKRINDTYGHVEGDKALLLVSSAIKKIFGPENMFLARYGGDEFVAIGDLPGIEEAEELRMKIDHQLHILSLNEKFKVTLSIGIAECDALDDNIPDFFERADQELYREKNIKKFQRS